MTKFEHGDIIKHQIYSEYPPTHEYHNPFLISDIKNNKYILQQPNSLTELSSVVADEMFELDTTATGMMVHLQKHIKKINKK